MNSSEISIDDLGKSMLASVGPVAPLGPVTVVFTLFAMFRATLVIRREQRRQKQARSALQGLSSIRSIVCQFQPKLDNLRTGFPTKCTEKDLGVLCAYSGLQSVIELAAEAELLVEESLSAATSLELLARRLRRIAAAQLKENIHRLAQRKTRTSPQPSIHTFQILSSSRFTFFDLKCGSYFKLHDDEPPLGPAETMNFRLLEIGYKLYDTKTERVNGTNIWRVDGNVGEFLNQVRSQPNEDLTVILEGSHGEFLKIEGARQPDHMDLRLQLLNAEGNGIGLGPVSLKLDEDGSIYSDDHWPEVSRRRKSEAGTRKLPL